MRGKWRARIHRLPRTLFIRFFRNGGYGRSSDWLQTKKREKLVVTQGSPVSLDCSQSQQCNVAQLFIEETSSIASIAPIAPNYGVRGNVYIYLGRHTVLLLPRHLSCQQGGHAERERKRCKEKGGITPRTQIIAWTCYPASFSANHVAIVAHLDQLAQNGLRQATWLHCEMRRDNISSCVNISCSSCQWTSQMSLIVLLFAEIHNAIHRTSSIRKGPQPVLRKARQYMYIVQFSSLFVAAIPQTFLHSLIFRCSVATGCIFCRRW